MILTFDSSSSTASISSSILQYREAQGRTYHSDKFATQYFAPNDDQQNDSVDITHHYLTLLLKGKLYLPPLKPNIEKVLDIGTGTGIWAIDFADEFPGAQVIGTDLSPIQPTWVPPNVKFEIEDATQPWTWPENSIDFVHMRYLFGAIADWNALFEQAFRTCKPGGYIQSCEIDPAFQCEDGTVDSDVAIQTLNKLVQEGGAKMGRSFSVVEDGLQLEAARAAGFVDIEQVDYKVPVGGWTKDAKLAEVGEFLRETLYNDIEGYTLFLWHEVVQWPTDEYQVCLMNGRKALKNKRYHAYLNLRYVYARKPEPEKISDD
ncbi:S-adenosyl-L-methionine-dependent methyltransferase [Dactylonectria macrodidyma]|uniref:S-adenosyl-L-methionine-dependent methyltransferase n=1 Tax=Dactylonectria macrodidyma TaxID=307937 RepID=A0A9P9JP94_9HYPO|nr:S-adenosyl-L-methionine-dependent methyltransferase [Dactylonectria macrodidyma]